MKTRKIFNLLIVVLLFSALFSMSACKQTEKIVMGEGDWDSVIIHDQVAKYIIEKGYDVEVEIVAADTAMLIPALRNGDVDFSLEVWADNIVTYYDDVADGYYDELAVNFDDNAQGIYIPQYLKDELPQLVTVRDLIDPDYVDSYIEMFRDPEDTSKGVIYGGPESWAATAFLNLKMEEYGLDQYFNFKTIDSTAALNTTLAAAYRDEEPWIGYNWEPTWIMGIYDMYLLEDDEYSEENFNAGIGAFPSVRVTVAATAGFDARYPEITEFLSNYETSTAITNAALAYMQENEASAEDTAIWFLDEYDSLWSTWVPSDVYDKVKATLN